MLKEAAPNLRRIAMIFGSDSPPTDIGGAVVCNAATLHAQFGERDVVGSKGFAPDNLTTLPFGVELAEIGGLPSLTMKPAIIGAQLRAARALLNWSRVCSKSSKKRTGKAAAATLPVLLLSRWDANTLTRTHPLGAEI